MSDDGRLFVNMEIRYHAVIVTLPHGFYGVGDVVADLKIQRRVAQMAAENMGIGRVVFGNQDVELEIRHRSNGTPKILSYIGECR